jgi:hypothetical protein
MIALLLGERVPEAVIKRTSRRAYSVRYALDMQNVERGRCGISPNDEMCAIPDVA